MDLMEFIAEPQLTRTKLRKCFIMYKVHSSSFSVLNIHITDVFNVECFFSGHISLIVYWQWDAPGFDSFAIHTAHLKKSLTKHVKVAPLRNKYTYLVCVWR